LENIPLPPQAGGGISQCHSGEKYEKGKRTKGKMLDKKEERERKSKKEKEKGKIISKRVNKCK
jgi:hypothetical protein